MSKLTENEYSIKDLYIVKLSPNYKKYLKINDDDKQVNYLDSINYFIVERCATKENVNNGEIYYEFYTECVLGKDFYERSSNKKIQEIPEIFEEIYPFCECLTEEEKKGGIILSSTIFQVFMRINNFQNKKSDEKGKEFVKRIKPILKY